VQENRREFLLEQGVRDVLFDMHGEVSEAEVRAIKAIFIKVSLYF
jgi:hypothetical protein